MNGLIGKVANYRGDRHPWMRDYDVRVIAVIKRPGGDPDAGCVCRSNRELDEAGGLDPEHDIIEVVPWLERDARWGWVSSDVFMAELVNLRAEL